MHTMRALVLLAAIAATLVEGAAVNRQPGECLDSALIDSVQGGIFPSTFRIASASSSSSTTQVTVSRDFSVQYFDTYKIVTNIRASNETYVLYQCGTTPPASSTVPPASKFFEIPLTSVSVSDTTALAFLDVLGVSDRVRLTTQYAVNACQQSLGFYSCKQMAPSNLNPSSASGQTTLLAASQQVDAFFTFSNGANNKSIAVTAAPDPGVLNRAEWVKFLAPFFNKEDVANTVFSTVSSNYASLKEATTAALSASNAARPIMAWLLYTPANPSWGPGFERSSVQISFNPFRQQYTQDSGAQLLNNSVAFAPFIDGTDVVLQGQSVLVYNTSRQGEVLRAALSSVDIVIDESRYPDVRNQDLTLSSFLALYSLNATDAQTLKFIRDGRIIRQDGTSNPDGYTSWFETAVARPDAVLRDLISFVLPSALPAPTSALLTSIPSARILRSLTQGTVTLLQASQCPLPNCRSTVTPICPLLYKGCDGTIQVASAAQRCAPSCNSTTTPSVSNPPMSQAGAFGALPMAASFLLVLVLVVATALTYPLLV